MVMFSFRRAVDFPGFVRDLALVFRYIVEGSFEPCGEHVAALAFLSDVGRIDHCGVSHDDIGGASLLIKIFDVELSPSALR